MGNKDKKFNPPAGYIIAVRSNVYAVRAVSLFLNIDAVTLADALERSGFQLIPDPFDLSADSKKVLEAEGAANGSSDTPAN